MHCVVVMPDHVHLIVTLFDATTLAKLLKQIKGGSSYRANKMLGTSGPIWQHESFDHILRRDEDLQKKAEYICNNPVRAGLVRVSAEYRWLWRAIDEEAAG
jgi:REP element-mobilizing transposase RayT